MQYIYFNTNELRSFKIDLMILLIDLGIEGETTKF